MRYIIGVIGCWVLLGGTVIASGLGIAPAEYAGTITQGDFESFELTVFNTSDDPGIFQVYADEQEEWFYIQPEQFRLDPGEEQVVDVLVTPDSSGKFVVNLSIVGRDVNRQSFNAASGLKFPVTLIVNPTSQGEREWLGIIAQVLGAAVVVVVSLLIAINRKRGRVDQALHSLDLLFHHKQKWYHKILRRVKK